jgi:hypothetical protein
MVMNFRAHPRLRHLLFPICILALLSCERIRVKPHPEQTVPAKPPPSEPIPTKPAPVEPPQERPLPSEPPSPKTYSETVSKWKSYQDLVRWMEKEFSLDRERFKRFEGKFPPPRPAEETFKLRSGIYVDAAIFAKETLNRVDPTYGAKIVVIIMRPYGYNHYVCSFMKGGMLFMMDYGTPYREVTGVHGPYHSLEEYRRFFEKNHPIKRRIEAVHYLGN